MAERKSHDLVLAEVRKPAGYGDLVAVISTGPNTRELWFQHHEDADIIRVVTVDVDQRTANRALTITTKATRDRQPFKL